jgi:hypothetical protein
MKKSRYMLMAATDDSKFLTELLRGAYANDGYRV